MNLTEWWLDDKTNFTLTFLLFFPAYLSYSYMVLDNHTFRDLHGYRNSLMLGPQNQDFLPKINMLKRNYCILWIQWMTVCQKVTKSDLKNEISTSRIIENFLIFFSIKNDSLFRGGSFCQNHILNKFEALYVLSQIMPDEYVILSQPSCFLGPTNKEILQPNWH